MNVTELYNKEFKKLQSLGIDYNNFHNKSILITGVCGLIGSYLVDFLMYLNNRGLNCKIYGIGRNSEKGKKRFMKYWENDLFEFVQYDINDQLNLNIDKINYVVHLASKTHPKDYSINPIETITTNVIGTYNMLNFAKEHDCDRFVFASSCEIYGENRGDVEKFNEKYCGYIDCNTLRAGYPESKRCGEALCQAFLTQKNLDVVIPRFSRIFGPTMLMSDTKALSQFIKNGLNHENIVLKSNGEQYYSYMYVADAVSALLAIILNGKSGEAYNISDENNDIKLKDLARIIAEVTGTKVVFELPDEIERRGYSKATKSRLDNSKIKEIGWKKMYSIDDGIINTINIMKNEN